MKEQLKTALLNMRDRKITQQKITRVIKIKTE